MQPLNYATGGGKLMLVLLEVQVLWLASHADASEHCLNPIGLLGDACCRAKVVFSGQTFLSKLLLNGCLASMIIELLCRAAFTLLPLRLARFSRGRYGRTQSPTHETNPSCG